MTASMGSSSSRPCRTTSTKRPRCAVDPGKDVDGYTGERPRASTGKPRFVPATPVGIMRLLQEYEVRLEGARAVVVGRSLVVGKPMSMLLLGANATVTTTLAHGGSRAHA